MGQTTILIMVLTIVSKIFGFVRESVMAAFIGAGELKSIYTTAMTIPNVLTGIVVSGVLSSFIPMYNKVLIQEGENKAKKFTSNIINVLILYGLLAMFLIIIFARPISKLFSPDLSGDSLELAINFTRIVSISMIFYLTSSVAIGYMNIYNNFVEPILSGLILNIIIIISTIFTGKLGNPYILILGTLLANIMQFIRFPRVVKKIGFEYNKIIDFNDQYIKTLILMMIPIIVSSASDKLSILVDNSMASAFFGVVSVSKIFYAKTMLNFIMGVVTMTVATVSFPEIARLGQAGEIDEMKSSVSSAIIMTMLLVIPATCGMMALANPIIKLAFERNAFTSADTLVVASLMVSYGPFIIFTSFMKILGNAFYSIGDSKTPVIIILIQQAINIILNFILVNFFGINGLALATAISTAIGTFIMLIAFSKKIGSLNIKTDVVSLTKITIVSLIMSFIALIVYNLINIRIGLIVSLLVSVSIAGAVYLVLIYLLRINEVKDLVDSFKNRIK